MSVVTDSRLKFFDSDVFTNVKSNSTLKSKVRKGYSSQCALCGSNGSAPAWPLSVAHLAPNNTALNYGEFGPPRYLTDCQPESIRNRMLLCGTKGDHGSCHSLFDFHNVIVYYDGFEATYKSLTLVPVIGSAFEVAYATSVLTFPPSLPVADYPYRRILAWRMRHAAVKHASTLDADRLETIVRMSELSEMPEMADRNDLDGEDASNEYGGSSNGDDVTNRSSGQDDGAAVLGSVIAQMGAMPNFSSEVGSL